MELIDRNSIRIVFAILISLLLHVIILNLGSGKTQAPLVGAVRKKVTVRLVARKAPAKPVAKSVSRPVKKVEKAAPLEITEPVAVVVREIPPLVVPASPVVPEQVVENAESAPEVRQTPEVQGAENNREMASAVVLARPLYKENPPPEYPAMARRRQLQGTVLLEVAVSREGKVEGLEIAESSGHKVLDRAAVEAVRYWLFEPGREGGRQVPMKVLVPVRFSLK
ncbi:MAG: energy transducer TonB [Proteobacteria bacterium]|nr:energy transducer TonB [Pseudomonadota bacterium]MBU1738579.1 energy transducer TonB [Pseudomonadota bacterium]